MISRKLAFPKKKRASVLRGPHRTPGGAIFFREQGDRDAEALDYCRRARISDASAIASIVSFYRQALPLFAGGFVCWPLRSAQNTPDGTTYESLGRLGTTRNPVAVAVNTSVTRNANGLTTAGLGSFLVANLQAASTAAMDAANAIVWCGSSNETDSESLVAERSLFRLGLNHSGNNSFMFLCNRDNTVTISVSRATNSNASTQTITQGLDTFHFIGAHLASTSNAHFLNDGAATTNASLGTRTGSSESVFIGNWAGYETTQEGRTALALIGNATNVQKLRALYIVYKNTLGQGLGLP